MAPSKKPEKTPAPDHTAVRVALWRALHLKIDPPPHILTDEIGMQLAGEDDWRNRPDMDPTFSKAMRASIVGRARFIEDLVEEQTKQGLTQYVILGAGLDTFAQRRPDLALLLTIFEVDQPETQEWKQKRLKEIGFTIAESLHFVPVNLESEESWLKNLIAAGFDKSKPAVIVSTGVSMYLSKEKNLATLKQIADLASGSTFVMTFLLSLELLESDERSALEYVMKKAQESGTPFRSLFSPTEILASAKKSGIENAHYISSEQIYQRYFANRSDGLRAGKAEGFFLAKI